MNTTTATFYAVRIICTRNDGEPAPVMWIAPPYHDSEYVLRECQETAKRFKTITEAKRALKYACVRDKLASTTVRCPRRRKRLMKKHGDRYNPHWHGSGAVKCRYEAEAVKLIETRTYETEIIAALPKRAPIEQLARCAE